MEIKVDGIKYEVTVIPPHLSPYNVLIGNLLSTEPKNCVEAEQNSNEMRSALTKLLEGCVKPKPRPEDEWKIWNALQPLTRKALLEAGLFRKDKGSHAGKGRAPSAIAP